MSVKKILLAALMLYLVIIISFSFMYSRQNSIKPHEAVVSDVEGIDNSNLEIKNIYLYIGEKIDLSKYTDSDSYIWDGNNLENGSALFTAVSEGNCPVLAQNSQNNGKSIAFDINVYKQEEPVKHKYKIIVYKKNQTVVVFDKDKDGNYTVPVKVMLCATGGEGDETISGDYTVKNNYRWRLLKGPSYGQYATSFSGSYLFHSMPYDTMNESTMWDNSYELLGTKSSHGCIRMALIDTKWIYDHVELGSPVSVVSEASKYQAPPAVPLVNGDRYDGWDPTDISEKNPYKTDGLTTIPVAHLDETEKTLDAGENFTLEVKGSGESFIYSSTDTGVAEVDENGKITAKNKGKCTIYIIGNDGADTSLKLTVK